MKSQRLDQLADGIFAIVMTLIAFDLKVPVLNSINDYVLWHALGNMFGLFLTFILSFALLFTYWRAHHFIVSVYAQNLTVGLINFNAIFFFLVALVPFTTEFLGTYSHTRVGIIVYGVNVILIGTILYFMRRYIELNPEIHNVTLKKGDIVSGYTRILVPVFSSLVAIALSLYHPTLSLVVFTLAILFNLFPNSTQVIHRSLDDDMDIIIEK